MPRKDHHEKDYDAVTQIKLDIFGRYVTDWLPTFIMEGQDDIVYIVDYFAGPGGVDGQGVESSPKRIMKAVTKHSAIARKKGVRVRLIFNEYISEKAEKLQVFIDDWLNLLGPEQKIFDQITVKNLDFLNAFAFALAEIGQAPSLQILDQCGVEFASQEIVERLCNLNRVDFLIFISSQTIARFKTVESIAQHFPQIIEDLNKLPAHRLHQGLAEGYAKHVCVDRRFSPFALRRGGNYYGIIFSSAHARGIEKFLKIAWKLDPKTGEANFVLPNERNAGSIDLFTGKVTLSKIDGFKQDLLAWIDASEKVTNQRVFDFTQSRGFTNTHSDRILRSAKKAKRITFVGPSPKTGYPAALGKKKTVVEIKSLA